MSFIKEWFKTDKERTQEVLDKCNKVYDDYGTNFIKYDSREKFEKKIKESMTGKLADYIEKEKIKKEYNEKVKKLCDDFEENLKKDKAQREV